LPRALLNQFVHFRFRGAQGAFCAIALRVGAHQGRDRFSLFPASTHSETLAPGPADMANNEYHFISEWQGEGTVEEVSAIITDTVSLPRWWPSVYRAVTELHPGRADGTGKVVKLLTRGWLPYSLDWTLRVTESRHPHGFTLDAEGDFSGRGIWSFVQDGPRVCVRYDWKIRADKPLLRTLSFAFRPVFEANHRWAMARGEESLRLELARRRAGSPGEVAAIPAPPGPARFSALLLGLLAVTVVLAAGALAMAVF
jgi:hypothetical protein